MYGVTNFKAYAAIKTGGRDPWSSVSESKLKEELGPDAVKVIEEHLENPKLRLACMRWACRGLALSDAIRKVLVDKEISDNCIGARGRA